MYRHPVYKDHSCTKDGFVYKNGVLKKQYTNKLGYREVYIWFGKKRHTILCHRFITECVIGRTLKSFEIIDHIDRNREKNNTDNLRIVSGSTNLLNHCRDIGVSFSKERNKFRVHVKTPGTPKRKYLGQYDTREEALAVAKANGGQRPYIDPSIKSVTLT